MSKLRECPNVKCNSKGEHLISDRAVSFDSNNNILTGYVAYCIDCSVESPWFKTKKEAVEWWNTRPDTELEREAERLKEEIELLKHKLSLEEVSVRNRNKWLENKNKEIEKLEKECSELKREVEATGEYQRRCQEKIEELKAEVERLKFQNKGFKINIILMEN